MRLLLMFGLSFLWLYKTLRLPRRIWTFQFRGILENWTNSN